MGGAKFWSGWPNCRLVAWLPLFAMLWTTGVGATELHWQRTGDAVQSKMEVRGLLRQAIDEMLDDGSLSDARIKGVNGDDPLNNIDRYIEELVLRAESLDITGGDGHMVVRMEFDRARVRFNIASRDERAIGQIYAIDLDRVISFEVFSNGNVVHVSDIQGLTFQIKVPVVSEAVRLMQMAFDIEAQRASIYVSALYDWVRLVAHASVRFRSFEGVEWFSPVLGSLPDLFEGARFRPSTPRDAQRLEEAGMSKVRAEDSMR